MGPRLRAEVQCQLVADLHHYGVPDQQLSFDWSETVPEGHLTQYLDGELENWSGILVRDEQGRCIAEGWLEFIHGGHGNPLFVFWDLLTVVETGIQRDAKHTAGIPRHIWNRLPDGSRKSCANLEGHDSQWSNDPLVKEWRAGKHAKIETHENDPDSK